MRIVYFLALFLCVTGSRRIQLPPDAFVCDTWGNRDTSKPPSDYCCLQSCDEGQQEPYWCYVRELQNRARYCSPPQTQTHKGTSCLANQGCRNSGTKYSWCRVNSRVGWEYCSVKECGTDRTCYVDSAGNVRRSEWAVHIYVHCETSGRTKRDVADHFKLRHMVLDQNEWNPIDRATTSQEIKIVLERRFSRVAPRRLTKRFNTFINLADPEDRRRFLDTSNNVPQQTPITPRVIRDGTYMGDYQVVTFENIGDRRNPEYSRNQEKSGRKGVLVHACNQRDMVDHYHGMVEPNPIPTPTSDQG